MAKSTLLPRGITEHVTKPAQYRSPALEYYVHIKDEGKSKNVRFYVGAITKATPEKIAAALIRALRLRNIYEDHVEKGLIFSLKAQKIKDVLTVFWFSSNNSGLLSEVSSEDEAHEIGKEWLSIMQHRPDCRYEIA